MPPIILITGKSNSGKTTLIEKILPILLKKGLKVSTIKHTHHHFEIDKKGKDSYRHKKAGALATVIIGRKKIALQYDTEKNWPIEKIISTYLWESSLVLVEGFKNNNFPKLEIIKYKKGLKLKPDKNRIGFISDTVFKNPLPVFHRDDIKGISKFILKEKKMDPFSLTKYYAKKKFWKLFGGEVRIFDESRKILLFFVKQKAFKLKEDITVFADENKTQEILKIQARSIIDFSAAYDIQDVRSGEKVGALRRKGMKSILRDTWEILDTTDNVIGQVQEDSMGMAILRRFLTNLIPQKFTIVVDNNPIGSLRQTFNPFVPQFEIDFSNDVSGRLDRRLGIGIVILLQIIEGRQK